MLQEFDNYIKNYRTNCDDALWLSGETSEYFAQYKAQKLYTWFKSLNIEKKQILDFGCGDGLMTDYVSRIFSKTIVFGVDPSPKSISEAQKKFSHINFSISSENSTELDFDDNSFDLIFSAGTFHHIPFTLHKGYILELLRILKPEGTLVIFELNPLNPLTMYTFKHNPIDKHAKMLAPRYAYRLVEEHANVHIKFICFFPKFLKFLRFLEPLFVKIPIGALYTLTVKK